ncbi:glycosyltransferase 87 family protein [Bacteroidota bacterium]
MPALRSNIKYLTASLFFILIVITISYFTARHHTLILFTQYTLLFGLYMIFLQKINDVNINRIGRYTGILARLSLLLLVPNLSDDIFRFIWDGHLVASGLNPFSQLPSYWLNIPDTPSGINNELLLKFGAKDTYSCYPPINQFIFWISIIIPGNRIFWNILIMRLFILTAEFGNFWIIPRLLKKYKLPVSMGLIWYLNPLVILELTGNLHFEAIMVFFLLLSLYYFDKTKWILSAIFMGLAVSIKLIPLIFLPLFFKRIGIKNTFLYSLLTITILLVQFIPFVGSDPIYGFFSSLSLYFHKLEFNASVYYLLREVGYWVTDNNIIQALGPFLAIVALTGIIIYSKKEDAKQNNLATSALWVLMIYVSLSTTLHPWYITSMLVLNIFTRFRFTIVWSYFIFFTYAGYSVEGFQEPSLLIFIEYAMVYGVMLVEIYNKVPDKFNTWFKVKNI